MHEMTSLKRAGEKCWKRRFTSVVFLLETHNSSVVLSKNKTKQNQAEKNPTQESFYKIPDP